MPAAGATQALRLARYRYELVEKNVNLKNYEYKKSFNIIITIKLCIKCI